jgi:hypothetical protein
VGAGLLCLWRERLGASMIVGVAAWAIYSGHYFNHLWFLLLVALTFVIFTDVAQQRLVVRCQLSILYGFAAIAKVHGGWLSGEALAGHGTRLPELLTAPAAVLALSFEAVVAGALWWRRARSLVLALAAPMHLGMWLSMDYPLLWSGGLLIFNGLAFGLLVWSTRPNSALQPSPEGAVADSRTPVRT